MRDFAMDTEPPACLNSLTLARLGRRRLRLRLHCRPHRPHARADGLHPRLYSISSARLRFLPHHSATCRFRFLLGLGMGGEWSAGAALIAETWRPEHRGKALGLMQSSCAIGEAIAALVVAAGPAALWLARRFLRGRSSRVARLLDSPQSSRAFALERTRTDRSAPVFCDCCCAKMFSVVGALATAMNACAMFGYWGLFTWIPAYFSLPVSQGGRGLSLVKTTTFFLVLCFGKWLGYALFGFFADAFGRRKPYFAYLIIAAALVPLYGAAKSPFWLLVLGPLVAFFGTGFFSGYAAIASEIFPGEIRAAAMGLSYNIGRGLSAFAPFAVGALAVHYGIGPAFLLQAAAFLVAALLALALPETVGRALS